MQNEHRMTIPEENLTCVYCIENKRNGRKYIGSTYRLKIRIKDHLFALSKGKHKSPLMQQDFESGDDFTVCVLKAFPDTTNGRQDMLTYEHDMIVSMNTVEDGYNNGVPAATHKHIYPDPTWHFNMQNIEKMLQPISGKMNVKIRSKILQLCKTLECEPDDLIVYTGNLKYCANLHEKIEISTTEDDKTPTA